MKKRRGMENKHPLTQVWSTVASTSTSSSRHDRASLYFNSNTNAWIVLVKDKFLALESSPLDQRQNIAGSASLFCFSSLCSAELDSALLGTDIEEASLESNYLYMPAVNGWLAKHGGALRLQLNVSAFSLPVAPVR